VVIDIEDYLLGEDLLRIPFIARVDGTELNGWMVAGLITGLALIGLGAIGVPLAFIYSRLDRQVQATKQDEAFQRAAAELQQEEAAEVEALRASRPVRPTATPVGVARWSAVSTALVILLFVWFALVAIRDSLGDGATTAGNLVLIGVLIAAVLLVLLFRRVDPLKIDAPDSDYQTLNWGWVWVAISGLLILGVGTGLALAMSAG
jgi:hypothetical protein